MISTYQPLDVGVFGTFSGGPKSQIYKHLESKQPTHWGLDLLTTGIKHDYNCENQDLRKHQIEHLGRKEAGKYWNLLINTV